MAYEDFTDSPTWTEVDPEGELTVDANEVAISAGDLDDTHFLYKDGGANHYTNSLEHQFELTSTAISGWEYLWCLNDDPTYPLESKGLFMGIDEDTGSEDFEISISTTDWDESDKVTDLSFNIKYYVTIKRDGPTVTLTIRTGSHTGSIVGTAEVEDDETSYRYLVICGEG